MGTFSVVFENTLFLAGVDSGLKASFWNLLLRPKLRGAEARKTAWFSLSMFCSALILLPLYFYQSENHAFAFGSVFFHLTYHSGSAFEEPIYLLGWSNGSGAAGIIDWTFSGDISPKICFQYG